MGIAQSAIRDVAQKAGEDNEKMANDVLSTMGAVAREKMTNFRLKVTSNSEIHEVPVDKVVYQDQMIYCSVTVDDKNLTGAVTKLIGNLATGKFVDAILGGASAIINGLLGSMAGSEEEKNLYRIVVGPLGGIKRIDFNLYVYRFTSETMIKIAKNIVVVSLVVSSVDPAAIDVATLRVVIEETVGEDISTGKRLLDDVLNECRSEKTLAETGILPERHVESFPKPIDSGSEDRTGATTDDGDPKNKKRKLNDS